MTLTSQNQCHILRALLAGVLCFVVSPGIIIGDELNLGSHVALTGFQTKGIDDECQKQFLAEASKGWRTLKDQLKGFQVEIAFNQQWVDMTNKNLVETNDWLLVIPSNGPKALVLEKSSLGVTATNERYSFQVRRESKDSPYMVSTVKPWLTKENQRLVGPLRYTDSFLEYARSIWWVPCEYIVSNLGDKGFRIISAQFAREPGGKKTAQIAFDYHGEVRTNPKCLPGATYWAEFLPEQNWVVLRSGVSDVKGGGERLRIRVTSNYQDWSGGSAFPKEIVLAYENMPDSRIVEIRRTSFGKPQPISSTADDEFYLPYYGISEAAVQTLEVSGRGTRIAINVIAIFILLAAVLILWYARRRAKAG